MAFIELKDVKKIFHAGEEEYAALKGISLGERSRGLPSFIVTSAARSMRLLA